VNRVPAVITKGAGLLVQHIPSVIAALAVFATGWLASKLIAGVLRRALSFCADQTLSGFLVSTVRFSILTIVGVSALEMSGVPSTSFLTVIGAVGLAISLALKDTLGQLAAGVVLMVSRPFKIGDRIEVNNVSGTVEQVRIFTTVVRIEDGIALMPNSNLTSNVIKVKSA